MTDRHHYQLHRRRQETLRLHSANATDAIAHFQRKGESFGLADLYVWSAERWRPVLEVRVVHGGMGRRLGSDDGA